MNTVQSMWETYRALNIAPEASPAAVEMLKRTFYGGALSLHYLQTTNLPDASDAARVALQDSWRQELVDMARNVVEGPACEVSAGLEGGATPDRKQRGSA